MHIALLIDDGPTAENLQKFIGLFQQEKVRVTFSFVGKNAEAQPALAKTAVATGHEVANHSYSHKHPAQLDQEAIDKEVLHSRDILASITGLTPAWYWPPFVEITPQLEATVARSGTRIYRPHHLVVSNDYMGNLSGEQIRSLALEGVKDGTTILFHEWRKETLEQMPAIIAELRQRGAVFMTISELASYLESSKEKTAVPAAAATY